MPIKWAVNDEHACFFSLIYMHPESREETAFVTYNGLHEFNAMPFGLTNCGASFHRLMRLAKGLCVTHDKG